jgi:hypothetical protein
MATGTLSPAISCSTLNRLGKTSIRSKLLAGKTLYGCNLTNEAPFYPDPAMVSALIAAYGFNWVRLHHIDYLILNGKYTVGQLVAFLDFLHARGIKVSLDGFSLMQELYTEGNFKVDLCNGGEAAEKLYYTYFRMMEPVLRHPSVFMVCLANETAALITPKVAEMFWDKWAPQFHAVNNELLLTDCPDGVAQNELIEFADLARRKYDLGGIHYYNSDGEGNGTGNNVFDGWNWLEVLAYAEMCGKPIMVQEFGSYRSNPNQGVNHAFVMAECVRNGFSSCQFAFAHGPGGFFDGDDPTNVYGLTADPLRRILALLGAHLYRYGAEGGDIEWGALRLNKAGDNWDWGYDYRWESGPVLVTQDYAEVYNGSKLIRWEWDKSKPERWLLRSVV